MKVLFASTSVLALASLPEAARMVKNQNKKKDVEVDEQVLDGDAGSQGTCNDITSNAKAAQTCSGIGGWHPLAQGDASNFSVVCVPTLFNSGGATCTDMCAQEGFDCVRGQDNVGSACTLDANHDRQTTAENGCLQKWGNQVCQCGLAGTYFDCIIPHSGGQAYPKTSTCSNDKTQCQLCAGEWTLTRAPGKVPAPVGECIIPWTSGMTYPPESLCADNEDACKLCAGEWKSGS